MCLNDFFYIFTVLEQEKIVYETQHNEVKLLFLKTGLIMKVNYYIIVLDRNNPNYYEVTFDDYMHNAS